MNRKRKEMTQKDYERIQERHFRRIWPYFERLEVQRILDEMDRQREAKALRSTGEDD